MEASSRLSAEPLLDTSTGEKSDIGLNFHIFQPAINHNVHAEKTTETKNLENSEEKQKAKNRHLQKGLVLEAQRVRETSDMNTLHDSGYFVSSGLKDLDHKGSLKLIRPQTAR